LILVIESLKLSRRCPANETLKATRKAIRLAISGCKWSFKKPKTSKCTRAAAAPTAVKENTLFKRLGKGIKVYRYFKPWPVCFLTRYKGLLLTSS